MAARYPSSIWTNLIEGHTMALASLAERHPLDTGVPSCGDWTLADLVWHLAEVQSFWVYAIANRPAGPESYSEPERPDGERLAGLLRATCAQLVSALEPAHADEPAWSWSNDHTVGFTLRRQTHEALIHHIDGVLAVGEPMPIIDPLVAADGVDELVTVMLSGVPEWADFTPDGTTIVLATSDTGHSWSAAIGRMRGIAPDSGLDIDLPALELIDRAVAPAATISAPAQALDLWLWGRAASDAISVEGDSSEAQRLRAIIAATTP